MSRQQRRAADRSAQKRPIAPAQTTPRFGPAGDTANNRMHSEHPDRWLWCLHCERFFQAKHLRPEGDGDWQACAFCNACGIDVRIFEWDNWPKQNPALRDRWPKSTAELSHGLHCPLYA